MHADASAGGHDVAIVQRVGDVWQPAITSSWTRIQFGGGLHGHRFVRPLGIELAHERIEAALLLEAVHPWRPRGFLFQGQMHALVATVLLRMSGPDALDGDAQSQPPD